MDFLVLITLIVVFALIGFIVGLLVSNLRTNQDKPQEHAHQDPNLLESARLLRDQSTGKLLPEIKSEVFRSVEELSPEQKGTLMELIKDLAVWLAIAPPSQKESRIPGSEAKKQTAPLTSTTQFPPDAETEFHKQPETETGLGRLANVPPRSLPSISSDRKLASDRELSQGLKEPPKSVIAQIDEILQRMLKDSPLKTRGIKLDEKIDQSLSVLVGLKRYDSVDQIPDEQVRAIIQQAVKLWEKRR